MYKIISLIFVIFVIGGISMCLKKDKPPTPQSLHFLSTLEKIEDELIIGIFPHSELQTTASLNVFSRESLLSGTLLTVMKPGGNRINDEKLVRSITNELNELLGGWFSNNLVSFIELYDNLVSQHTKENYRNGTITIQRDEKDSAFYYLEFVAPPWQVQAVGQMESFLAIFLGQSLSKSDAIGEGGHPLVQPIGSIDSILASAVPNIAKLKFKNKSREHATNVYDTYLIKDSIKIKAGVRMRLSKGGVQFNGEQGYFYGIRINIDIRQQ